MQKTHVQSNVESHLISWEDIFNRCQRYMHHFKISHKLNSKKKYDCMEYPRITFFLVLFLCWISIILWYDTALTTTTKKIRILENYGQLFFNFRIFFLVKLLNHLNNNYFYIIYSRFVSRSLKYLWKVYPIYIFFFRFLAIIILHE